MDTFPSEATEASQTLEMFPPPLSVAYFGAGVPGRVSGYLSVLSVTLQMEDLPFHFCLPWTACQVGLQPRPHAPRRLPGTHRRRLATGLAGQHPAGWGPTSQGASPPSSSLASLVPGLVSSRQPALGSSARWGEGGEERSAATPLGFERAQSSRRFIHLDPTHH